jgi:FlaA1/EpsC-like NDP-sugar epimerase
MSKRKTAKGWLNRLRSPAVAFVHDMLMVPVAWFGALWLRFNFEAIPQAFLQMATAWLPLVMGLQLAAFVYFGLYRGHWRFASMPDLVRIIKAVAVGGIAAMAIIFMFTRLEAMPRSLIPLYMLLLIFLLGGPRFLYRWFKERKLYMGTGKRVLIVGAGRGGEMLVRDMLRDPDSLQPVAFVDDDPRKRGIDIHGVRVAGSCALIPALVDELDIDMIIIAMPSASSRQIRYVVELCESAHVAFRMLPKMADLIAGRVSTGALREVSIEDLLGRDPVSLDLPAIRAGLAGKCILISGGGGSIGSELCRQVARLAPARLVVLDHSEFNLYKIDFELNRHFPSIEIVSILGDVTDATTVEHVFDQHRPAVVLHAAAYKHVPLLEPQVREAIHNNVVGTKTIADAASRFGCEIFVMVSTDKAVNPANIMGASKRIAEIYCQNLSQHSSTRYITVRFGNVLGSAGSVVPLFMEQIQQGGPVTVTHPEITRYFMTIPEASQLILQAGVMGKGGEIYVLDMGQPVKIIYLAEQMIRLSGLEPGKDIEIKFTGLRPGEKLYEELFHEKEALVSTAHSKILLAKHRGWDWDNLQNLLGSIGTACQSYDEDTIRELIHRFVPELTPPVSEAKASNVIPMGSHKA